MISMNTFAQKITNDNIEETLSIFTPSKITQEKDVKFYVYNDDLEVVGYTLADTKTLINNNKNTIHVKSFIIEDYYNKNDRYIETKVKYSEYHKNKVNGKTIEKNIITKINDRKNEALLNKDLERFVIEKTKPYLKAYKHSTVKITKETINFCLHLIV
jgi:hypothetical protein